MSKLKVPSVYKNTKNNKEAVNNVANIDEKIEERHLKHWIVKVLVLTLSLLTTLTVLTFLYSSLTDKTSSKEGIITSSLQALIEIIKFMMTPVH